MESIEKKESKARGFFLGRKGKPNWLRRGKSDSSEEKSQQALEEKVRRRHLISKLNRDRNTFLGKAGVSDKSAAPLVLSEEEDTSISVQVRLQKLVLHLVQGKVFLTFDPNYVYFIPQSSNSEVKTATKSRSCFTSFIRMNNSHCDNDIFAGTKPDKVGSGSYDSDKGIQEDSTSIASNLFSSLSQKVSHLHIDVNQPKSSARATPKKLNSQRSSLSTSTRSLNPYETPDHIAATDDKNFVSVSAPLYYL